MKLIKQLSLVTIVAVALAVTGCKKNAAEDAAATMCDCAKPMVALTKKMEELKDKPEEMVKLAGEAQTISTEMGTCIKAIETKYADKVKDAAFEKEVKAAMDKKCPEVTKLMNSAGQ